MPNDIPDQLEYLRATLNELAKFDPEDLGDDNPDAMDLVEAAVRQRVAGMTSDKASAAVQSDADLLSEWSASPEAPDTASYVYGALFGMTMYADLSEFTGGT